MSPALAAVLIDGALGMIQIGAKSVLAIKKAAAAGGEFTPDQLTELDERISGARAEMDALGVELDALADL